MHAQETWQNASHMKGDDRENGYDFGDRIAFFQSELEQCVVGTGLSHVMNRS
jgi:hypothetical protein